MNIITLSEQYEPMFWEHVNQDILHYFFFVYDWVENRENTQIWLALEDKEICGMMLVYNQRIAQLRGSLQAITLLLNELDLDTVELQALPQHEGEILKRYEPATLSTEITCMVLHQGQETLHINHRISQLSQVDAEPIAVILREAIPEIWGELTGQRVQERMNDRKRTYVGVKRDGTLVSVCSFRHTNWAGIIGSVATHEEHMNQGYATSLVSYAIRHLLRQHSLVTIYVRVDNPSAIHVYQKVGFQPYRTYFYMKGTKQIIEK